MMQSRSAVRSMITFSKATKTVATTGRNCRINYINKSFFSSLPTHAVVAMPSLSPVS